LPSDPVTLLGTLTNDYDLAVALDLSAVPEAVREAALARAKADAERELVRNPEETDEEYAARKVLTQQVLRIAGMAARQLDQVTLGWVLDAEAGKTHLDLSVTAKTGSDAAGWFGRLEQTTSRFAGFLEPEATLSGNWSIDFGPADAEELAAVIGALRKKAIDDIDRQEKSPEEKELARKLVNNLLDVAQSTLVTGRFDGGMAVRLAPGAVTLASGKYVAGVEKVDATIRELVETLRRYEPAAVEQLVKLNAAEQAGVQFHTLTVPVNDDNRAAVEQMFGGPVEVVVGLGEESVYAAVGRDALKTLQEYVDRSNPRAAETVAPLEFSLDVGQMAAFAAEFAGSEPERQQARKLAEALAKAEGDADRVTLTAAPIAHGVRLRLDVEDGILKALGELARQRQTGGK
jgi:hypothetical protein